MRTIAYVDGYNLYYSRLRGTPFKWLDLHVLLQGILHVQDPAMQLVRLRYFTSPVIARLASHGLASVEARLGLMEQAVLVSSDTDLVPALEALRADFSLALGLVLPRRPDAGRPSATSLMQLADWTRTVILDSELAAAQLPARLPTRRKPADKPAYW